MLRFVLVILFFGLSSSASAVFALQRSEGGGGENPPGDYLRTRGLDLRAQNTRYAENSVVTEITIEQLRAKQAKLKTFEVLSLDFVQMKKKPKHNRTLKRLGKAIFAKPDRFVWRLETPLKEYKIYDGKDFYDYSPDEKAAVKYRPTGPQSYQLRQIVDLVLNFDSLLKRYELVKAEQDGDDIKVTLKPKTEGEVVSIELGFSEKKSHITFLKMVMSDKVELSHEFTNPSFTSINGNEFSIPSGVKITDSK